jgi:antirestriction protein ArdC
MTNAEIIYRTSIDLVKAGKLNMVTVNGEEMPEPIHTFQAWKSMGYSVKKGEKSDIKITIWKHASKMAENEETHEETEKSSMFMKTAAFFKFSQVEKIKAN